MQRLNRILFAPVHRWLVKFRNYFMMAIMGTFLPLYVLVRLFAPAYEPLSIYYAGMGILLGVIPSTFAIMFIELRYGVTEEMWSDWGE